MQPPQRNKGYDHTLEETLILDAAVATLREALFAHLACPQCGAALFLCPWAYERKAWQCLTEGCNWHADEDTAHAQAKGQPHTPKGGGSL